METYRHPSTAIQSPLDKVNSLLKEALIARMAMARHDFDEVYRICIDKIERAASQCLERIDFNGSDLPESLASRWSDDIIDLLTEAFNKLGFRARSIGGLHMMVYWGQDK